jgi:hypothetical protein
MWKPFNKMWCVIGFRMEKTNSTYGWKRIMYCLSNKRWSSSFIVVEGLTHSRRKSKDCYEILYKALELDRYFGTTEAKVNEKTFRKWSVRSLMGQIC